MDTKTAENLRKIAGTAGNSANLIFDEPLSKHTGFRTGGCVDAYIETSRADVIKDILALAARDGIPVYVIGNGSNLLVSDEGFRGIIIRMKAEDEDICFENETFVRASAGCPLGTLAHECAKKGLTGLEFAAGIPGSVGGAVVMNAGAYGGEIKDVLTEVTVMDKDRSIFRMGAHELKLGYRTSIIPERGLIVLSAAFELKKGDKDTIFEYMSDLARRRKEKQPLEYPSAGSTFKRPEGYFAGKLIEDAGLKGFGVGGAQVSEKHAGFVINKGGATSKDIFELIEEVRRRVREDSGVELEPEVKLLGF